jgi:hypothetical protein
LNLYETWYIYHGTWAHLNGIIRKPHQSVIPALEPLKILRPNLNIAWSPVPIFMKLNKFIMPHEAVSTAYSINPFDQWYQHYSLSNCCGNNRNVTLVPEQIFIKLVKCIMPHEAISTAYIIHSSHQ